MAQTSTIKHYAKALVELGIENQCYDALVADLVDVDAKINENLEFKKYLTDKHVTFAKKQEALKNTFKDFVGDKSYNFLFLLIKEGRLLELSSILEIAAKTHLKAQDLFEIIVESVVPLTAKQEKEIAEKLAQSIKQKLIIKNIINPEIIGGLKIFLGDTEIDGSIRGKILRLKKKIEDYE
ncbi:MAG: ATP synthase subunit delta [Parcubacteria group bacterium GW2011_GWC2_38_7]|nr:MAG: ATP synthase subunit delta [Parcubacteria group bacterium GW2011_GWC2_38_7]